jgi:hypothetical protein
MVCSVASPIKSKSDLHCRGNSPFFKLTAAYFASFRSGLPLSRLPQAFRDAALVTKELGVRYLWIDALCIIQGTDAAATEDFLREGTSMSHVYSRTSCNIVAMFGKSPHESLFTDRSTLPFDNGRLKTYHGRTGVLDDKLRIFESWPTDEIGIVPDDILNRDGVHCEVASRGWIMQELYLSPRALLYGRHQAHWVCNGLAACELWPNGNFSGLYQYPVLRRLNPDGIDAEMGPRNSSPDYDDPSSDYDILWPDIIHMYSELSLTFPRDRLVALSGVAKTFQRIMKSNYLAGHWESTLPLSLLWERKYRTTSAPSEYIAPSWSWASLNRAVMVSEHSPPYIIKSMSCLGQLLDRTVFTAGDDPMGAVEYGELSVHAPLFWSETLQGDIMPAMKNSSWPMVQETAMIQYLLDDEMAMSSVVRNLAFTLLGACHQTITSDMVPKALETRRLDLLGLLLLPEPEEPRVFKRIGLFKLTFVYAEGNSTDPEESIRAAYDELLRRHRETPLRTKPMFSGLKFQFGVSDLKKALDEMALTVVDQEYPKLFEVVAKDGAPTCQTFKLI